MVADHWADPQQVEAIEAFINLTSKDAHEAQNRTRRFREALNTANEVEYRSQLWMLAGVIEQETFFVDWKDTESFVFAIDDLAAQYEVTVNWGVDDPFENDFLDNINVPTLMQRAHGDLLKHGLTLWNMNTQSDCYRGWILPALYDAAVLVLSQQLDGSFRPGSAPF
jgi:hypothetical protein